MRHVCRTTAMEKFSFEHRGGAARENEEKEKEKMAQVVAVLLEGWQRGPDDANPLEDLPPGAGEALARAAALFSPLVRHLQEVTKSGKEVDAEVLHAYLSRTAPRARHILRSISTEALAAQWRAFLWLAQWRAQHKSARDSSDTT